MENFKKFEGIDYVNNFALKINSMHQLVAKNLKGVITSDHLKIIDIGGGPGIGAKIVDKYGREAKLLNLEPSSNVNEVPDLNYVEYSTMQLSLKQALDGQFPWKADVFLMISAAHEIALSNGLTSHENKKVFFEDLKLFVKANSKSDSLIAIGFPNYKTGVTQEDVSAQREFIDSVMGHSHPQEEFFTIEEFKTAFAAEPILFDQAPMVISGQTESETKLMANFALFRINDIK